MNGSPSNPPPCAPRAQVGLGRWYGSPRWPSVVREAPAPSHTLVSAGTGEPLGALVRAAPRALAARASESGLAPRRFQNGCEPQGRGRVRAGPQATVTSSPTFPPPPDTRAPGTARFSPVRRGRSSVTHRGAGGLVRSGGGRRQRPTPTPQVSRARLQRARGGRPRPRSAGVGAGAHGLRATTVRERPAAACRQRSPPKLNSNSPPQNAPPLLSSPLLSSPLLSSPPREGEPQVGQPAAEPRPGRDKPEGEKGTFPSAQLAELHGTALHCEARRTPARRRLAAEHRRKERRALALGGPALGHAVWGGRELSDEEVQRIAQNRVRRWEALASVSSPSKSQISRAEIDELRHELDSLSACVQSYSNIIGRIVPYIESIGTIQEHLNAEMEHSEYLDTRVEELFARVSSLQDLTKAIQMQRVLNARGDGDTSLVDTEAKLRAQLDAARLALTKIATCDSPLSNVRLVHAPTSWPFISSDLPTSEGEEDAHLMPKTQAPDQLTAKRPAQQSAALAALDDKLFREMSVAKNGTNTRSVDENEEPSFLDETASKDKTNINTEAEAQCKSEDAPSSGVVRRSLRV
eukprot:scaffold847_cov385-Prasinococcus_capsulatus_cf.AAC.4